MSVVGDWLDRFVDKMPDASWFQFLAANVVLPFWAWRQPTPPLPGGARVSIQPSENLQRMMNLVMPLKDKSAIGRARAAFAVAQNVDEIFAGLDNVGTVHFARFVLIGNYVCMISVYDGDFSNYIRDFIATIGSVFDAILKLVEGGEAVKPYEKKIEPLSTGCTRTTCSRRRTFRLICSSYRRRLAACRASEGSTDSRSLPREVTLQLPPIRNFTRRRVPRLSRLFRRASAPEVGGRLVSDEFIAKTFKATSCAATSQLCTLPPAGGPGSPDGAKISWRFSRGRKRRRARDHQREALGPEAGCLFQHRHNL